MNLSLWVTPKYYRWNDTQRQRKQQKTCFWFFFAHKIGNLHNKNINNIYIAFTENQK